MRRHVIRLLQHRQQRLQNLQGGASSLVPGQHSKPGGAPGSSRQQRSAQDSAQGEGGCGADSAVQLVMLAVTDAWQQLHQQRRLRHAVHCW
jgi:hypothetical protein